MGTSCPWGNWGTPAGYRGSRGYCGSAPHPPQHGLVLLGQGQRSPGAGRVPPRAGSPKLGVPIKATSPPTAPAAHEGPWGRRGLWGSPRDGGEAVPRSEWPAPILISGSAGVGPPTHTGIFPNASTGTRTGTQQRPLISLDISQPRVPTWAPAVAEGPHEGPAWDPHPEWGRGAPGWEEPAPGTRVSLLGAPRPEWDRM